MVLSFYGAASAQWNIDKMNFLNIFHLIFDDKLGGDFILLMLSKHCFFRLRTEYIILYLTALVTLLRHHRHSDDPSDEYNSYLSNLHSRLSDLQAIVQRENSDVRRGSPVFRSAFLENQ